MKDVKRGTTLPSIQVLRGIAAGLVVFYHYSGLFESLGLTNSRIIHSGLGDLGACGVDIFFVISGFIMVYTTTKKAGPKDARVFIQKRALRIYPLYWVWTTLLFVLWKVGFALKTYHYSNSYVIKSYLLIPSFDGTGFHPLLAQGWTLSFEMLFYIAFCCAVLLGLKRSKLPFLLAIFAAAFALGSFLPPDSGMHYLLTEHIILEFLFGVAAAEILLRMPAISHARWMRMLPIAFMSVGSIALLATTRLHFSLSMRSAFYGVPAFFIVFGAALLGSRPCPRWLVYLGDASYSIYLAHTLAAMTFDWILRHFHLVNRVSPDVAIVLAAPITIALCTLTYPMIERRLAMAIAPKMSPVAVVT